MSSSSIRSASWRINLVGIFVFVTVRADLPQIP